MTPREQERLARRLALAYHLAELALALAVVGVAWSAYWNFKRPRSVEVPEAPRLHEARLPHLGRRWW